MRSTTFGYLALGGFLVLLAGLTYGMFQARAWAEAEYRTPEALAEWESFRDDVAEQAEQPEVVRRRVPQSVEPPALVLLRDHFATCLVISLVLSSALYGCFAFFLGGVLVKRKDAPTSS